MKISDFLNNREIAILIWLLIIFLWMLTQSSIRSAFIEVLKSLFAKKILLIAIFMSIYIFLMVLAFERIGFWDITVLKDTVFWVFGVAFIMFINLNNAANDAKYFRKAIIDSIKIVIVLEFVINLYSFNLIVELLFVPILGLIAMMSGISSVKPEYKQVNVLLNYVLGFIGIVLLIFTIYQIVIDFQDFASLKNIRDFLVPILFTIAFLPIIYLMAIYIKYEDIFIRIDIANTDIDLARYAKQKILFNCHLDLRRLNRISRNLVILKLNNRDDVSNLLRNLN